MEENFRKLIHFMHIITLVIYEDKLIYQNKVIRRKYG
jgi:hypothetical protein